MFRWSLMRVSDCSHEGSREFRIENTTVQSWSRVMTDEVHWLRLRQSCSSSGFVSYVTQGPDGCQDPTVYQNKLFWTDSPILLWQKQIDNKIVPFTIGSVEVESNYIQFTQIKKWHLAVYMVQLHFKIIDLSFLGLKQSVWVPYDRAQQFSDLFHFHEDFR